MNKGMDKIHEYEIVLKNYLMYNIRNIVNLLIYINNMHSTKNYLI